MSRNKKKKKIAGQNLSLTERLERHWTNEKWESFFSLYMRDREASERGPWAARFPDALYNCLTAALFLHQNYDGTRQVAEMMLAERSLGTDDDVLRECARTALDFINIREGRLNRPSDGEGRSIALPEPYEELRRKLADVFAPSKRGRKRKEISNPTIEKLAKQFKSLPSAKNSAPYASFLKTAETLVSETEGTGSAAIFRAVRDIASIMREVARGAYNLKDPTQMILRLASKGYHLRTNHPALLTLWEYMCKLGGRKFGDRWENAARAGRMSIIFLNEEFKPAYDKLTSVRQNFSGQNLPDTAERNYDGWTEQERFILIFLAISFLKGGKGPDYFEGVPANTILRWFKTLGEIGGRRRPEGAWPESIRFAFEKMAILGGHRYLEFLVEGDLPYECMTAASITAMVLYAPHTLRLVKDKLKSRLPLNMSGADERALDDFFPHVVFSVPVLKATSELFDNRGKEIFFKSVLISTIRTDLFSALTSVSHSPTLWSSMSQSHIALFLENLPDGSHAAAFCRLCLGQKPMSLSDDTSLIAAFFSSRPEHSIFNATLSLFLMTWPGISVEFLLRLFEHSIEEHEHIDDWEKLLQSVSKIQNPNDRKNVARGVSRILKRRYRNNMSMNMAHVVKSLGTLEKSGKLPENDDDALEYFNGLDMDMLRLLKRFGKKKNLF
ncbi:MAG: hypothetical protein LBG12_06730 [Synergistaceae bacterium]|nr:hypothetical protein [Synergistaceae bacterium]